MDTLKRSLIIPLLFFFFLSCTGKREAASSAGSGEKETGSERETVLSVLVYVTGVVAESPTYELLVAGAEEFARSHEGVKVKVYEAGFNQAEWEEQLGSLVAGGGYDLVLGSNPSLPEICANVGEKFPRQKFIITDAEYGGNPRIATWLYDQYEQSLYLGYLAGLITVSGMEHANAAKKIGFIAAQEYPLLNRQILPGFLEGARLADPEITMDFRIIGNWFDAGKAAELASGMIAGGVDVFGSIAGGATQGILRSAGERGAYVVVHNISIYGLAPVIAGCGIMEQKKLVEEILAAALDGTVEYGAAKTVGLREGYLGFAADDPGYRALVPEDIRRKLDAFIEDLRTGAVAPRQEP
ncbi:MAG: BMP family ABC transporter substrate-binding protein [Treponema sp.]|jgi:simple sugar transport system substrate-binding protein|nr:BMP family ABC transporter substrate-binding protein [Treponema sp.]